MDISSAGSSAPMRIMATLSKLNPEEIAQRIMKGKDANGDGVLSADEVKTSQDLFDGADTDGDGAISMDELVQRLTERLSEVATACNIAGGLLKAIQGSEQPDLTQMKSLMEILASETQPAEQNQTGYDMLRQLMSELGLSDEQTDKLLQALESSGLNIVA